MSSYDTFIVFAPLLALVTGMLFIVIAAMIID